MGRRKEEEEEEEEEPVTPAGRFFLQPDVQNIIHCVVGLHLPIQVEPIKAEMKNTLLKHPRFCSLLVRDEQGREYWRRTEVEMDNHVIFPTFSPEEEMANDEEFVNHYLADLAVSCPLDQSKPLWELHILKPRKCAILRLHHALGDGISLMSLFLACCRRAGESGEQPAIPRPKPRPARPVTEKLKMFVMMVWFTLVYCMEFVAYSLWKKDPKTAISGGSGVELWPRKVATARFSLEDMKVVKNSVDATINDVLFAIITSGLTKYLEMRSPRKTSRPLRITGLSLVNTRHQPGLQDLENLMKSGSVSRWGNQMGYMALPVYLDQKDVDDPLEYVKRSKAMLDRKKLSLEAHLSYRMGALIMSLFGPKIATLLNYRIISNTTFTISNVLGPQEEIMFAENPIKYLRVTSTSIPHAITMHMVSYNGNAEMQILVAKEIIPDPQLLAKCFQYALLEMKEAATSAHA